MISGKSVSVLISALQQELERNITKLRSPGHPRPYFISYLLRDTQSHEVWARYGSVASRKTEQKRQCYADVRVGSYRYDQVTGGGLDDNSEEVESFDLLDMPIDNNTDALRFCLWRLTDAKYREAVKSYHRRKARDVSYLDENKKLPSLLPTNGTKKKCPVRAYEIEEEEVRRTVSKLSMVFKNEANIKNSYVEFRSDIETKVFVSSEGCEHVWQVPIFSYTIYLWYLSKSYNQDFSLHYSASSMDDLPSLSQMKKIAVDRIALIKEIEKGVSMTSYAGPVLLAPKPAGLFVHEVLGHRLEGSRLLSESEGRTFKGKEGQRVMTERLSVMDDPSLKKFNNISLVGSFDFDDEGCAPKPAVLIDRGHLKGFLSTRSPYKAKGFTANGHARNQGYERPISRMGNLIVKPHDGLSWDKLKAQLIVEIKRRDLPFGLILYEVEGGETGTETYNFQAFLGEITVASKIYPNGREQYIRGVDFVGTPLSSLNTILEVGDEQEVDNGYCGAESGTVPVSTISPGLLLANLELQSKDPTKVTQYRLPLPWMDSK